MWGSVYEYALKSWINRAQNLCLSITYSVQMLVCFDGLIAREIVKLWRYICICTRNVYVQIVYVCYVCKSVEFLQAQNFKNGYLVIIPNFTFPTKLLTLSLVYSQKSATVLQFDFKSHTNTTIWQYYESSKFFGNKQMKRSTLFSPSYIINGEQKIEWERASTKLT